MGSYILEIYYGVQETYYLVVIAYLCFVQVLLKEIQVSHV